MTDNAQAWTVYNSLTVDPITYTMFSAGKAVHLHVTNIIQLALLDLHNVLCEYEFAIIYAIYFEQRSVAEVAQQKHKTRQAINQIKIKALKMKAAWCK